ncbi:hypothetical protein AWZ03_000153 [Drosophila navojoa]|uniref:Uncharacterized protein n=1 Tax=Drosophila navojoa TaxID=7232 RepID=A0A484BWY4_DRONA|nr:hypothetical protein AWZ03_000153 [Drosophila navojoa]
MARTHSSSSSITSASSGSRSSAESRCPCEKRAGAQKLLFDLFQDIVPMEQVSSMVSNGGGSVTMQRDDEYRNRIMKSKCVSSQ